MSMTRLVAAVAMVMTGTGVAAAETEPLPCNAVAPMPDATLRDLRVAVAPATDRRPVGMTATPGSVFPAISADGETIALLFLDAEDYVEASSETVVFFRANGERGASFRVGGPTPAAAPPATVVARVNARLAKTTWRALPTASGCEVPGTASEDTHTQVKFADGHTFTYDEGTGHLTTEDVVLGQPRVRSQRLGLGWLGWSDGWDANDKTRHGCGDARAIDDVTWSPTTRLLFAVPRGRMGGDSCIGNPSAETVVVAKIL